MKGTIRSQQLKLNYPRTRLTRITIKHSQLGVKQKLNTNTKMKVNKTKHEGEKSKSASIVFVLQPKPQIKFYLELF